MGRQRRSPESAVTRVVVLLRAARPCPLAAWPAATPAALGVHRAEARLTIAPSLRCALLGSKAACGQVAIRSQRCHDCDERSSGRVGTGITYSSEHRGFSVAPCSPPSACVHYTRELVQCKIREASSAWALAALCYREPPTQKSPEAAAVGQAVARTRAGLKGCLSGVFYRCASSRRFRPRSIPCLPQAACGGALPGCLTVSCCVMLKVLLSFRPWCRQLATCCSRETLAPLS